MKNNRDNVQRPHNLPWNRKKPKASHYQSPAFEVKSIISVYKISIASEVEDLLLLQYGF